ncbi:ABC-2 family transporter protein [Candidatus Woesearchaeota archaeon]|nr:ABC-2 family transporter protein [Candidatus Woesearchaeota archaeon]
MAGNFKFFMEYMKMNLQTIMEYRFNFFVQGLAMFVNDIFWLGFWFLFYAKLEVINGWDFFDLLLLYAFITTIYGIVQLMFGNWDNIAHKVAEGELDFYLALPKPELLHLLISKSDFTGIGDFMFGVCLAVFMLWNAPWSSVLLFLYFILTGVLIMLSLSVVLGSLSFFFGNAEEFVAKFMHGMILFTTYPFSVFGGIVRFIMLFILPAGLLSGLPVEILKNFSYSGLIHITVAAIVFPIIAYIVWKIGMRRYGSGNLISVRA